MRWASKSSTLCSLCEKRQRPLSHRGRRNLPLLMWKPKWRPRPMPLLLAANSTPRRYGNKYNPPVLKPRPNKPARGRLPSGNARPGCLRSAAHRARPARRVPGICHAHEIVPRNTIHATCLSSYPAVSKSAGRPSPAARRRIISSDRGRTRLMTSATRAREPM